jgi:hypothetical protein
VYFRRISRDRQGSEARKNQENPLRFFSRLYERQKLFTMNCLREANFDVVFTDSGF